jgi:hypothetical protein
MTVAAIAIADMKVCASIIAGVDAPPVLEPADMFSILCRWR